VSSSTRALLELIRDVPDFPKPGIVFKDITPLLASPAAFQSALDAMAEPLRHQSITAVAAIESRGFIFGAGIAARLGCGLVLVRKPGKLPWKRLRHDYALEYGNDALEIHADAVGPDDRVAVVDDVLATGGTAAAAARLLGDCGADVTAFSFLIELGFLEGRGRLATGSIHSAIMY
jgi:adenine phosphoribosyltransferase